MPSRYWRRAHWNAKRVHVVRTFPTEAKPTGYYACKNPFYGPPSAQEVTDDDFERMSLCRLCFDWLECRGEAP